MDRKIFDILYRTEEKYWWFVGQRFLLGQCLKKYYKSKKSLKLLDAGCGTGITLSTLKKYGKAYGIDVSDDAIRYCKARGASNVRKSDVMDIKFKSNMFDVVTSFGVFYHRNVRDDAKGMREIRRVLKPGGRLIFFDCAMMELYGKHDIAFDGIRRYSRKELYSKLNKAGFKVEEISYINSLLFPAVFIRRKLEKFSNSKPESEVQEGINPIVNSILQSLYKLEILGLKFASYPFGINIIAVARK